MFAMVHNAVESKEVEDYLRQEIISGDLDTADNSVRSEDSEAIEASGISCKNCLLVISDDDIDSSESLKEISKLRLEQ